MLLFALFVVACVVVLASIASSQTRMPRSRPIGPPVPTYYVVDGNGKALGIATSRKLVAGAPAIVVARIYVDDSKFLLPLYNDGILDVYVAATQDGNLRVDSNGVPKARLFEEVDGKLRSVHFGPLEASLKPKTK
jgi:hypothetical protein